MSIHLNYNRIKANQTLLLYPSRLQIVCSGKQYRYVQVRSTVVLMCSSDVRTAGGREGGEQGVEASRDHFSVGGSAWEITTLHDQV